MVAPTAHAVGRSPMVRLAQLAFTLAIAAELALVFALRHFVTVDGAFHDSVAALFRDIIEGHGALAKHYYTAHPFPVPNLLPDLVLTGFMLVFNPAFAEKLLIVGYIVGLPLALLYAVRAIRRESAWLAFLAFPLTFSHSFNYGFYNFSYSLILFLLVAGYTLRHRRDMNGKRAAVLAGLLVLTYFTHIVGFLEAVLFVIIVLCVDWVVNAHERGSNWRLRPRRLLLSAVVLVPSALLAAWFFLGTSSAVPSGYESTSRVRMVAELIALGWGVTSYGRFEVLWTLLVAVVLGVLLVAVARGRERPLLMLRTTDAPFLFAIIATLAFVVAPFQVASGGSFITQRLALFPVYGAILWIAAHPLPRSLLVSAAAVGLVAAAGLGVMRLPTDRQLDSVVTDFMSVEPCLAPNSTMIQGNMAVALPGERHYVEGNTRATSGIRGGDIRLDPVTNETGLLAADLHGIDLGSPEGSVPFYLLRFRSELDPRKHLVVRNGYIEGIPPPLDLLGYQRRTPGRVDYILLFGPSRADRETLGSPIWAALRKQLNTGYRLVAVSPHGWLQAWERRGSPAATVGRRRRLAANAVACRPGRSHA